MDQSKTLLTTLADTPSEISIKYVDKNFLECLLFFLIGKSLLGTITFISKKINI